MASRSARVGNETRSRPSAEALWPSSISLNARLFDELVRAPVPVDMRVVRQLWHLRWPMAMDIYQLLTYRQHRLLESGQPRVVIPWHSLAGRFGAGYGRIRDFKRLTGPAWSDSRREG